MDITLEQVEKVRSCTGATYEEAKAALEATGGNVLDAVILLEKQGKTGPAGGDYSTRGAGAEPEWPAGRRPKNAYLTKITYICYLYPPPLSSSIYAFFRIFQVSSVTPAKKEGLPLQNERGAP